jgi:hypothetical protein
MKFNGSKNMYTTNRLRKNVIQLILFQNVTQKILRSHALRKIEEPCVIQQIVIQQLV